MFERFTTRGRQVVVFAQDEARSLGQSWLGTEHLLLGLIREGGEASIALERAGLTLGRARDAVTTLVGVGEEPIASGQIRFTREARRALEGSLRESVRLQAGEITPSLVLLGVLAVGSGTAACVLRDCGVDVAVVVGALGMADRIDASLYRQHEDAKPEKTLGELSAWSSISRFGSEGEPLYEGFTERARQVMVLAQDEALALKHNYVGTEHILLGLLRVDEGFAARVLGSLDVTIEEVRVQTARIVGEGNEVTSGQLPFTPRTKKVLELSLREARSLGHGYIGTEHILLGLVRENQGVAARVLLDFDADAEKIRNEVIRMLSGPGRRRAGPTTTTMSAVREEALDPAARSMTVGGLIDLLRTSKEAAIKDEDFGRAATLRVMERQLSAIIENISDLVIGDQGSQPADDDEAPSS